MSMMHQRQAPSPSLCLGFLFVSDGFLATWQPNFGRVWVSSLSLLRHLPTDGLVLAGCETSSGGFRDEPDGM